MSDSLISLFIPSDYKIYSTLISNIGSVLVGAGSVGLIFDYVAKEDLIERISGRVDHINKMDLEEFYENRDDLPKLVEMLKDCKEVWCAWFTGGDIASTGKINRFKGIKTRLILTKPDSPSLNHFKIILQNENEEEWNRQIKRCTKRARENNIDVRWFDGPVMYSVIIVNPNGSKYKKSFAQLELVVPFGELIERPAIIVSPYRGKETFEKIKTWYETIWNSDKTIVPPN